MSEVSRIDSPKQPRPSAARFATTHWSVIITAGQASTTRSEDALEHLCRTYWPPVYSYLRRQGHSVHESQDLTQGFFARFLEKNYLQNVQPAKGKFRSYLLGAVKHFVSNERDRAQAKKRGGGQPILSLDFERAEGQYGIEPSDSTTAEKIFDRCWALALLDRVLSRLQEENEARGKAKTFEHLKVFITKGTSTESYQDVAEKLETTTGAVKVAAHRLRHRYREILKEEVSGTVENEAEIDEELRYLLEAVST